MTTTFKIDCKLLCMFSTKLMLPGLTVPYAIDHYFQDWICSVMPPAPTCLIQTCLWQTLSDPCSEVLPTCSLTQKNAPMQDAYECLQTSFAFDANFSAALPSSPQCGAFSATGNTTYCQQPVCQIYSVDMAFCGQEGLVTDQSQALLVMVCTQEVNVCLDCFTVSTEHTACSEGAE